MRILRIIIPILFVIVAAASVFLKVTDRTNLQAPKIACAHADISASISASDEELLGYVSATDAQDGDLTDSIIIESVSAFIEPGIVKVTFAVCDSDNNVSKTSARLTYTDYESPSFILKEKLAFLKDSTEVDFLEYISANDVIDGDISNRITILDSDFDVTKEGTYHITFKVSNSKADTATITLPVTVVSEAEKL